MANNTLSITYKFKGDTSGLKDMVKDVERMQAAFREGVQPAEQLRTSLINMNQVAQSFQQIGDSVTALSNVVQDLSNAYAVQMEAETKLETVMRQRMGATDEQIRGIKDLCSAQQELGVIGDEVQLAGAQQIATFLTTDEALRTLIPAMNNLVAQQKGLNATSGDCVTVANLMGKAMMGQASALRRVGITFSESEEAMLKNGNEQERAAMLAKIITQNVGEMNSALAATDAGKAKQVSNAMGDIKEQLGSVVASMAPFTSIASQLIAVAANAGRAMTAMRGLYTATLGANGAFKFLTPALVASATGMNAAGVSARFLAAGLRAVLAATGVGLVLAGISMAVEHFTGKTNEAADAVKGLSDAEEKEKLAKQQESQYIEQHRAQLAADIAMLKSYKGTKQQEQKVVSDLNARYGETMGYFSSVSAWYQTLTKNSETYARQMVLEARARNLANQV
ncbi:MAG: hypothetical protein NC204_05580, partial [Candidatus Amulumruptor caecigallinarius]|nr:hypothetical protein [Candidatus Amulumruptor caecigallinarius]